MSEPRIIQAETPEQLAQARELFLEYGNSLSFHICFTSFAAELAQLPGIYAPPGGRLLLATCDGRLSGCVALKPAGEGAAELKRLYVRPDFRGRGLGARLARTVIAAAREIGYRVLRLDTLPGMAAAQAVYRALGFAGLPRGPQAESDGPIELELRLASVPESTSRSSAILGRTGR